MDLTSKELFNLGVAYGSFSVGEINQGIHVVLPGKEIGTGTRVNQVFELLCGAFDMIDLGQEDCSNTGTQYMNCIITWAEVNGIDIGRSHLS